jgi:hypothetical protein
MSRRHLIRLYREIDEFKRLHGLLCGGVSFSDPCRDPGFDLILNPRNPTSREVDR